MYRSFILLIGLVWVGCDTTHKLTGTNYVDLESEAAPEVIQDYPKAVVEDAGWNDITTEIIEKGEYEEFRAWLSSSVYPGYLFKLTKDRKQNVAGESILYWPANEAGEHTAFNHALMQRYLEGICPEFFWAEGYGYCHPEYTQKMNWGSIYTSIESQEFWQLPAGEEVAEAERPWQMYVQMRLKNYYRDYTHINPENYEDMMLRNNVRGLSNAIKLIANFFEQSITTNTFEGVTDGTSFTICDSTETWEFRGDLSQLLKNTGLNTTVNTEEKKSLYYVMVKGRVQLIWYNEWATGEYDRILRPKEIYDFRVVNDIKCPRELTFKADE